ncbi:MAG: DUF2142 domain-containing protein [Patescibacteria group bacterium]|jgi:hypothetical protein
MTIDSRKIRALVLAAAFLFLFIKGVLFVFSIPPWQGHDEPAHFSYTQYLVEEKKLPNNVGSIQPKILSYSVEYAVSEQVTGATRIMNAYNKLLRDVHQQFDEESFDYSTIAAQLQGLDRHPLYRSSAPVKFADIYYQLPEQDVYKNSAAVYPPAYYLYEAIPYLIFFKADIITRMYAMRIFSSLLYLFGFWFCFLISMRLTKNFLFSITLLLTIGLLPVFSHLAAGINNDAMLFLLTTLSLYLLVQMIERISWGNTALLGLMFGLGLLTKPQFVVAPLLLAIPLGFHYFKKNGLPLKKILIHLIVCAGITLLICGWWYLWAYQNHNGIFSSSVVATGTVTSQLPAGAHLLPLFIQRWLYAFVSFNFAFGFATEMSVPMPLFIAGTFLWLTAVIGLILKQTVFRRTLEPEGRATSALLIASIVLLELFYIYLFTQRVLKYGLGNFPIDGRYYVPILLPILYFWLHGLTSIWPDRMKKIIYGFVIVFMMTANAVTLTLVIWPKFYL